MRTVRRLLYREVLESTLFVMVAFLALFFFIDFVGEMERVGRRSYTFADAVSTCLLLVPGHAYELAPIAVLIGGIYALARLAQSSEYTILRTGGLDPGRALRLLTLLGLGFVLLTFVLGDLIAPWSQTQATLLQSKGSGSLRSGGRTGIWLRDTLRDAQGREQAVTVNVGSARDDSEMLQVRIYEFDEHGALSRRLSAARARIDDEGQWQLSEVTLTRWPTLALSAEEAGAADQHLPQLTWAGNLDREVIAAAVLPIATMSTRALYTYMTHLTDQKQASQRYELQFWKRALYPFACLVMMALALPFAYLSSRRGGVGLKVFGGIMLGISFVLINNVVGHLALLQDWTPWLAAATPSLLYLLVSLGAFAWLVRYR
jgi:lipopolysaccharide export system permease protein